MESISVDDVARCMSAYAPLYRWHKPVYQYIALTNLQRLWEPAHESALDVGGGTGLLAQTVKTLFRLRRVASVDVCDRFLPMLQIESATYDGTKLPFADDSFDCVLLFNVLHHVPVASRIPLLQECRRVAGRGPIYIKDHLSTGTADDVRLTALDVLGNVPFSGMVSASYLREHDWAQLAGGSGHVQGERLTGTYRSGVFGRLFPNRLEVSMKWRPR